MEKTQFDDIRPYNAEEIPAAMVRIANSSSFPLLASYVYPDEPLEAVRKRIADYKTVRDSKRRRCALSMSGHRAQY